jgi:DNA-binding NtrC family response regulator
MPSEWPVLIVSGEAAHQERIAKFVSLHGLRPVCCSGLNPAKSLLARERFSVAFCSDVLPDGHFRDVIKEARRSASEIPVIVVSRVAECDAYLKAIDAGAFDYIAFPDDIRETTRILKSALRQAQSRHQTARAAGAAA